MPKRKRRIVGTGSIYYNTRQHYWQAKMFLADGRRVVRSHRTYADALAALDVIRAEFAGHLGRMYEEPRKRLRTPSRPAITRKVRFLVLERDAFRCRYCGASAADGTTLAIDHAQPLVDGGTNDLGNLVTACYDCNSGKAGRPLRAAIPS